MPINPFQFQKVIIMFSITHIQSQTYIEFNRKRETELMLIEMLENGFPANELEVHYNNKFVEFQVIVEIPDENLED